MGGRIGVGLWGLSGLWGLKGLLMAGLILGATGCRQTASESQAMKLSPCRIEGVSKALECGTVEVWEDRAAKSGRKLKLHVAVARALAPAPQPDPLFILAGGPGQSATAVAPAMLPWFEKIRRHRDIVFLDQRGTGKSNRLECFLSGDEAPLEQSASLDLPLDVARDCVASYDADVRFYGTSIAMDDLDDVRRALGYGKINLYGASYGTRAALVYLRQHPDSVRTAILDGVAPLQFYLPLHMAMDAERALQSVFTRCREDASCNEAFPDLEARVEARLAALETSPLQASVRHPRTGQPASLTITRDHITGTVRSALYSADLAAMVPLLLERAMAGDVNPLLALGDANSGGPAAIALGMMFSVICTEDAPFITPELLEKEAAGTLTGPGLARRMLDVCKVWPRGQVPEGFREPVRSDVPVLLLSGELDPVTPPRWGDEAAKTLSRSHHEVVPGVGHNALVQSCARELVREFIEGGSTDALKSDCRKAPGAPAFVIDYAGSRP